MLTSLEQQERYEEADELIRERCRTDGKAYTVIFFPHYATFEFNTFHLDYFATYNDSKRAVRRAWASPRGSAKSTHVTLIKPIHDVCYDLEQFILVISSTDDLAVAKLKDIRDEVLSNDLLRHIYGLYFDTKKPGTEQFIINSPLGRTLFIAKGSGAQIRGIRFGPKRPTKIILDDLEHSERVYSQVQRLKTENYFKEDVGKVGDEKTNIEFVGTILHRQSLLSDTIQNPAYKSKKYQSVVKWPDRMDLWNKWEEIAMDIGNMNRMDDAETFYLQNKEAMDAGAKVMWPEKEPLLHLFKEKLEIGRRAFFKEKQNEPMGADDRVFEMIHWYKEVEGGIKIKNTGEFIPWDHLKHSAYGALDPSTGERKPSQKRAPDFAVIAMGFLDPKGRLLVHKDWTKRQPPSKQIEAIYEHHEIFDFQKFGVETNLFRDLLMKDIVEERKRRENQRGGKLLKIPFYDILNTEAKDQRIHRLEPKAAHGWILFNENLSAEFQNQLQDYPYVDHDDCLDALEMLWMLVKNGYKASPLSINLGR